jgi:hypothetical protein
MSDEAKDYFQKTAVSRCRAVIPKGRAISWYFNIRLPDVYLD